MAAANSLNLTTRERFIAGGIGGLLALSGTPALSFLSAGSGVVGWDFIHDNLQCLGNSYLSKIARFVLGFLAGMIVTAAISMVIIAITPTPQAAEILSLALIITTIFVNVIWF